MRLRHAACEVTNRFGTLIKLPTHGNCRREESSSSGDRSPTPTIPREIQQSIQICVVGRVMVIDSRNSRNPLSALGIEKRGLYRGFAVGGSF